MNLETFVNLSKDLFAEKKPAEFNQSLKIYCDYLKSSERVDLEKEKNTNFWNFVGCFSLFFLFGTIACVMFYLLLSNGLLSQEIVSCFLVDFVAVTVLIIIMCKCFGMTFFQSKKLNKLETDIKAIREDLESGSLYN